MTSPDVLTRLHAMPDAPEILPGSANFDLTLPVGVARRMFTRATAVAPTTEVVPGTARCLLAASPGTRSTSPVLRVSASDGEQTISMVTDQLALRTPGRVLLPPRKMLDILKLAPEETVSIRVVQTQATVQSGRARWTLMVPNEGPFVDLGAAAGVDALPTTDVALRPFLDSLVIARKAASNTSARVSLMQVQVHAGHLIGCDGGRLHQVAVPGLDPGIDTTIPVRTADEIIAALREAQGAIETVQLGHDDTLLVVRVGDNSIVAQRMLLPFPDVRSLLVTPKVTNSLRLTVNRKDLDDSVRRVRVNADPDTAIVTLNPIRGSRSDADRVLEVRSRDRAQNAAVEALECSWTGGDATLTFNHNHLLDVIEACQSELLTLRLGPDTASTKHPLLVEDTEVGLTGIVQQLTLHW